MSLTFEQALNLHIHKQKGLFRERKILQSMQCYEGKIFCSFSSNDYLGLSKHPTIIKAFK